MILGGDPIKNTLFVNLGSEPAEIQEWQAGGDQMSAYLILIELLENII